MHCSDRRGAKAPSAALFLRVLLPGMRFGKKLYQDTAELAFTILTRLVSYGKLFRKNKRVLTEERMSI